MKCSKCEHNEANVYIEQISGGETKKMHLCGECAFSADMMGSPLGKFEDAFKNAHSFWFAPEGEALYQRPAQKTAVCHACGYSFERFRKSSLLGCAACYKAFRTELLGVFGKVQPAAKHVGKTPKAQNLTIEKDAELSRLKDALKNAISAEEYEEAAGIRDLIRSMEAQTERGQING